MKNNPFRKLLGACIAVLMVFSMVSVEILDVYAVSPTHDVSTDYKNSKYYENLSNLTLTGNQRTDVVRVALTQLGYHEGNSTADFAGDNLKGSRNFVEYNRYHGRYDNDEGNGVSYGYYWCASFATWCAAQAGIPETVVPTLTKAIGISTQRLRTWFINNATYHARGTYTPITGDYIFYKGAGATVATNHVGLVLYVKGSTVYAIEGNAGGDDCVALKEYSLSDTYIVGYGVPDYKTGTAVAIDLTNKDNPGEYVTTASSLAFRSGPGTSYSALGALPQTTVVEVSDIDSGWGKITYDGKTGWISLSYAMPLSLPSITVTYDANGGTGAPSAQGKITGTPLMLSSRKPTREGYTFLGWSTSSTATKVMYLPGGKYTQEKSIKLYAVWERESYTISFVDHDGSVLQSRIYTYGDTVTAPASPTRAADQTYTYTFSGWSQPVTKATESVTYRAQYDAEYIEYSIVFCDDDGSVLAAETYHYGDTITRTPIPQKAADRTYSYTFIGWGEVISRVTSDKVYTAVYDKTYLDYLVTFADENGVILSQEMYHYGDTVKQPPAPVKKSDIYYDYVFLGWDKTVSKVDGVALYTATYQKQERLYTVTFKDADGEVLSETQYRYGENVVPPADPTRETDEKYVYTFTGWSSDVTTVMSDAVYTAVYDTEPVEYTVTFRDDKGHIYATGTYHYGDVVEIPADPTKPSTAVHSYKFTGWSEPVAETVVGDAVYVAEFDTVPAGEDDGDKTPTGLKKLLANLRQGDGESVLPVLGVSAVVAVAVVAIVWSVLRKKRN